MTLTLVPSADLDQKPRMSLWTKISISLIVTGLVAIGTAAGIGVNWYGNLNLLRTSGPMPSGSVTIAQGGTYLIDELVTVPPGYRYSVNVRSVMVRVGANTADAAFDVKTCADPCTAPVDFHPGAVNLTDERVLVQVHATRPGTVVVEGVTVSYKSGIRHASQHLGPSVTITVRA